MSNKTFRILGTQDASCSVKPGLRVLNTEKPIESPFRGRAAVVTLGCAKNQVDSEVMLGVLRKEGFEIVNDVERADVAIVNTCGFLQSAIEESIDCILELAELKETGQLRRLIVAGCVVSRFEKDIREELPEVDAFITTDQVMDIARVLDDNHESLLDAAARPYFLYDDTLPRQLSTQQHYAYVKVSEGCNRPCTFCIIPKIRGKMRSRTIDSIVREARQLGEMGVKELNLIAQDLTSFGSDRKDNDNLPSLLRALNEIDVIEWTRLLYAYPVGTSEELVRTIAELPRMCNYLDIPLQHSSESVLKNMQRPIGRFAPRSIVSMIKEQAPEIAIRTTFIVGFPGETDADIDCLESFIDEGYFSSVGIFTYSQEQGTPAAELEGQLEEKVKEERRSRLMEAQQAVLKRTLSDYVGSRQRVLLEGAHADTDMLLVGRASFQAPEVDGTVIINDSECSIEELTQGDFVDVEITDVAGYDLLARVIAS